MTIGANAADDVQLDRIRKIYDAILAGDLARVMGGSGDEIEWRNPAEAVEPGTRRGKASFAEAVESLLAQFDYERLEIVDAVQRDDRVAVKVRVVATGKASGARIDAVFSHVFQFEGDSVLTFEWSPDPGAALDTIGADRWPGDEVGS